MKYGGNSVKLMIKLVKMDFKHFDISSTLVIHNKGSYLDQI